MAFITVNVVKDYDAGLIGERKVTLGVSNIAVVGDKLQYAAGAFTAEGKAAIMLANTAGGRGVYELDESLEAFRNRLTGAGF